MKETQYPNYFVNEQGDVFSTKRGSIKRLKPASLVEGYLKIAIHNNSKGKSILVHRLIAQTFIPNPENKPEVNHKNGIKSDNRVENLEWNTRSENMNHAYSIGLATDNRGENHGRAKVNEKQVLEIRKLYSKKTFNQRELSEIYGVDQTLISLIVNNKLWNHI